MPRPPDRHVRVRDLGRVEPDPLAARDRFGVKPSITMNLLGADSGWPVRSRRCTPPASPLSRTRPRGRLTWRRVCTTTTAGRSGKGFGSCLRGVPVVDSERRLSVRTWYDPADARARPWGGPLGESEAGSVLALLERAFGFGSAPTCRSASACRAAWIRRSCSAWCAGCWTGAQGRDVYVRVRRPAYDETPWVQTMLRGPGIPATSAGSPPATSPGWRHGCRRFRTSPTGDCHARDGPGPRARPGARGRGPWTAMG